METLDIANIPAATLQVLRRRARRAQQSVEEYVRDLLVEEAGRRSLSDILDEAGASTSPQLPTDTQVWVERHRVSHPE